MALSGTHNINDGGHTADHNLIDQQLAALAPAQRTITSPTTMTAGDKVLFINSAGAMTQALVAPGSAIAGRFYEIVNIGAGTVTISTSVSGSANRTLATNASFTLITDGNNWYLA